MTAASPDTSELTLQVDDYRMENIIIEAEASLNDTLDTTEGKNRPERESQTFLMEIGVKEVSENLMNVTGG
ncbi:hypothetical protein C1646_774709 [Rhizophagus diaphanus]|nr:hypothetical protein C1646_774709 [Rhizophagus diaphanus] [Rhizophagus sp. MUCL 43196]